MATSVLASLSPGTTAPEALSGGNAGRQRRPGERDAELAIRLLRLDLAPAEARVVRARGDRPDLSWSRLAASIGVTRDQAWDAWKRAVRRLEAADLAAAADPRPASRAFRLALDGGGLAGFLEGMDARDMRQAADAACALLAAVSRETGRRRS